MGITLLQGYGLHQRPDRSPQHVGKVQEPASGFSSDRKKMEKSLLKGVSVMPGYYLLPDRAHQVSADGGGSHTGDGSISKERPAQSPDRRKNSIVTAGGKMFRGLEDSLAAHPHNCKQKLLLAINDNLSVRSLPLTLRVAGLCFGLPLLAPQPPSLRCKLLQRAVGRAEQSLARSPFVNSELLMRALLSKMVCDSLNEAVVGAMISQMKLTGTRWSQAC